MVDKDIKLNANVLDNFYTFKCISIKNNLIKCYEELDKAWFGKKKILKKCSILESDYNSCIIENNIISSSTKKVDLNYERKILYNEYLKRIADVSKIRQDYLDGKISKQEFIDKSKNFEIYKVVKEVE